MANSCHCDNTPRNVMQMSVWEIITIFLEANMKILWSMGHNFPKQTTLEQIFKKSQPCPDKISFNI